MFQIQKGCGHSNSRLTHDCRSFRISAGIRGVWLRKILLSKICAFIIKGFCVRTIRGTKTELSTKLLHHLKGWIAIFG